MFCNCKNCSIVSVGRLRGSAEVSRIYFKMLLDENGQEYLLVYDLGQEYLFAVGEDGKGRSLFVTLL